MSYVIFIKMDGITGESTDAKHRGEIDVLSWSWAVTLSSSAAAGGASAARAIPADLRFTHRIDLASPSLIRTCASGRHLKEAVVTVQTAGPEPREFLVIKLSDVIVKSVEPGASTLEDSATENVALAFSRMEYIYTEYRQDGKPGSTNRMRWDVNSNKVA